jgi:hypothetical protein
MCLKSGVLRQPATNSPACLLITGTVTQNDEDLIFTSNHRRSVTMQALNFDDALRTTFKVFTITSLRLNVVEMDIIY